MKAIISDSKIKELARTLTNKLNNFYYSQVILTMIITVIAFIIDYDIKYNTLTSSTIRFMFYYHPMMLVSIIAVPISILLAIRFLIFDNWYELSETLITIINQIKDLLIS